MYIKGRDIKKYIVLELLIFNFNIDVIFRNIAKYIIPTTYFTGGRYHIFL